MYHNLDEFLHLFKVMNGLDLSHIENIKECKGVYDAIKLYYWHCGGNPRSLDKMRRREVDINKICNDTWAELTKNDAFFKISKLLCDRQDEKLKDSVLYINSDSELMAQCDPFSIISCHQDLFDRDLQTDLVLLNEKNLIHMENMKISFCHPMSFVIALNYHNNIDNDARIARNEKIKHFFIKATKTAGEQLLAEGIKYYAHQILKNGIKLNMEDSDVALMEAFNILF